MALQLFLVPMEGSGTHADPWRAKYVNDANVTASGSIRSAKRDECVVLIQAPQAYLDSVAAQADTITVATPGNIDNALNQAQVDAVRNWLEARSIPGDIVNVGDTRRQAIRAICRMFFFCQRCEGMFGQGFKQLAVANGITLSTQFQDFPQAVKNAFIAVRDAHGWDNLGLTTSSTLREILVAVAGQFQGIEIVIGGVSI